MGIREEISLGGSNQGALNTIYWLMPRCLEEGATARNILRKGMRWTVSQERVRNLIQQAGNVMKEARTKEKVGQRVEVFNNPSSQARVVRTGAQTVEIFPGDPGE